MAQVVALYIDCILRKDFEVLYVEQSVKAAQLMETPFDQINADMMQIDSKAGEDSNT